MCCCTGPWVLIKYTVTTLVAVWFLAVLMDDLMNEPGDVARVKEGLQVVIKRVPRTFKHMIESAYPLFEALKEPLHAAKQYAWPSQYPSNE